jgi:hypothetical protein
MLGSIQHRLTLLSERSRQGGVNPLPSAVIALPQHDLPAARFITPHPSLICADCRCWPQARLSPNFKGCLMTPASPLILFFREKKSDQLSSLRQ